MKNQKMNRIKMKIKTSKMDKKTKKKPIKTLIFDYGRVLATTNWEKFQKSIMKKHGFSIFLYSDYPKKIQNKFKGLSTGKHSYREVLKELSGKKEISAIVKDYKNHLIKCQKPNKTLLKHIKKLKKQYLLIYLSNITDLHLEAYRDHGLFFKHFKYGHGSCELGFKKPDRRIFLYVIKRYNLKPEETVFIDDKKENVLAAKKLGMKAIQFKNNSQLFKDLRKLGVKV